ncbi:MAG: branched-chain amino acid ABC transporter substrate-binding protein [Myxococcota bacterium]
MLGALAACGGKSASADAGAATGGNTSAPPPATTAAPAADAGGTNAGGGTTSGTIRIVSSLPLTGSANAQTSTTVNGVKLAIDEVGGKVGDFTITYESWDDASAKKGDWDPEVEAANADKAVNDKDVMAYIGTYNSGAAMISMPVLNKAGILMVSPANTYPGLTKPGMGEAHEPGTYRPSGKITYYRVVPADDIQGAVGAKWMQKMGAKSVYVLHDNGLYGKGVATVFQQTAEDLGLKVVAFEAIDPKAQEYKSLMTKIKESNPDFVYYGGTTQTNAGQLVKDFVAVGLTGKIMLPDGCYEEAFIQAAGADNANDRVFLTFGGLPPDKLTGKGADFVKAYKAKFGGDPEAYAVYGYVAAKVVLEAIKIAGKKDRDAIAAAAAQVKFEDSALGKFSFTADGDTTMTMMSGNTVKAGKFEFVTLLGTE